MVGNLAGNSSEISMTPIFMKRIQVDGIFVGSRVSLEALVRAVELHRIEPVVDRVFPVSEIREALDTMARREHFGKIVLEW